MSDNQNELARSLKARHITMIALGGAIGAGMFKGSSSSISLAGPGVVLAYLLVGLVLLTVMQGLAEMVVRNSNARTFRELIEPILGRFAGHLVGWMYWMDWVLVLAAECATAAVFLNFWFTNIPLWLLSLIVAVAVTALNLFQVNVFGETEFWFAGIKIAVLLLFILLGGSLLFTGYGDLPAPGFSHLTDAGGFFPNGFGGIVSALLIVLFSFGGIEMIGMTLGETKDAQKIIPKVARSVIFRILVFYVLPLLVIVSLVPWNQLGNQDSPFVTVFQAVGIPAVSHIMNFVMLTAVLSAANTGMYAASRMLYTQATSGQAPRYFAKLSKNQVPVRALLVSTSFLYVGVIIAFFAKGETFNYLMVIPGYSVLMVWILLLLAHLKSRGQNTDLSGYHVKWFPYTTLFALIALLAMFVGIVITTPLPGTLISLGLVALIALSYRFTKPEAQAGKGNTLAS
ncbi:MAG: amino acid permease [Tumebacillaceae bacterium]